VDHDAVAPPPSALSHRFFIAMPIVGGRQSPGVICVTDRHDDQPFTEEDVSILRAMAAPAALGCREHAFSFAEGYALTAAIDPLSGHQSPSLYMRLRRSCSGRGARALARVPDDRHR
jgi:GAF domain-containing protein